MKKEELIKLIRKTAFDSTGKKLGKIIDIREAKPIVKDGRKTYLFIEVRKFLFNFVLIPLDTSEIQKIDENGVWFDILKKDFDIRKSEVIKQEKERNESLPKTEPSGFHLTLNQTSDHVPKLKQKK
jgi:hypothetical protein